MSTTEVSLSIGTPVWYDLNILYNPIIHACDIYLNSGKREEYKVLFENMTDAFLKLKETYKGTEIVYTIENIEKSVNSF